jgi:hypothetical protein
MKKFLLIIILIIILIFITGCSNDTPDKIICKRINSEYFIGELKYNLELNELYINCYKKNNSNFINLYTYKITGMDLKRIK